MSKQSGSKRFTREQIKKARKRNAEVDKDPEPVRDPEPSASGTAWFGTRIVRDTEEAD